MLPKIKGVGKIVVYASTDAPTAHAAGFNVEWRAGLAFRNSDATAALCIYEIGKDPASSGLHLDAAAGQALAVGLMVEAAVEGSSVEIDNHSNGREQLWRRFSDADALDLSARIWAAL